jgi:hypothetical protein
LNVKRAFIVLKPKGVLIDKAPPFDKEERSDVPAERNSELLANAATSADFSRCADLEARKNRFCVAAIAWRK